MRMTNPWITNLMLDFTSISWSGIVALRKRYMCCLNYVWHIIRGINRARLKFSYICSPFPLPLFPPNSIGGKCEIKVRKRHAQVSHAERVYMRMYKYLPSLAAYLFIWLCGCIARCISFTEKGEEEGKRKIAQPLCRRRQIISSRLLEQFRKQPRPIPSLVCITLCRTIVKKISHLLWKICIKDDASGINAGSQSLYRLSSASLRSNILFRLSATYFEKAFIVKQTLVLSNYRSSKVTLISFSMY